MRNLIWCLFLLFTINTPSISQVRSTSSSPPSKITDDLELKRDIDEVKNLNYLISQLVFEGSNENKSELKNLLNERLQVLKRIALNSPSNIDDILLSSNIAEKIPPEYSNYLEETNFDFNGTFARIVVDDFKNKSFSYEFIITDGYDHYYIKNINVNEKTPPHNCAVSIKNALKIDDVLLYPKNNLIINQKYETKLQPITELKILLLVYFEKDYHTNNILSSDLNQLKEQLSPESLNNRYYREVSNGKCFITKVDVVGWIYNKNSLDSIIASRNINFSDYDYVVEYKYGPATGTLGKITTNRGTHGWVTLGMVSQSDFEKKDYNEVLIHELGHCFGFSHASTAEKKGQDDYFHDEYGDNFCIMGFATGPKHFRGYFKTKIGWLDSASVLTINKSGRYKLNSIEQINGHRLARIPINTDNRYVYLEFMNASAFDNFQKKESPDFNFNGLFFYSSEFDNYFPFPNLEANDSTLFGHTFLFSPNWFPWTITGNNTYVDSTFGFSVGPIVSFNENTIEFDINFWGTQLQPPQINIKPVFSENGILDPKIKFQWNIIPDAEYFEIKYSYYLDGDFTTFYSVRTINNFHEYLFPPNPNNQGSIIHDYYWRIRYVKNNVISPWTSGFFRINYALYQPNFKIPFSALIRNIPPRIEKKDYVFRWQRLPFIKNNEWNLQLSTKSEFDSDVINKFITTNDYRDLYSCEIDPKEFNTADLYYVRVKGDSSVWSSFVTFKSGEDIQLAYFLNWSGMPKYILGNDASNSFLGIYQRFDIQRFVSIKKVRIYFSEKSINGDGNELVNINIRTALDDSTPGNILWEHQLSTSKINAGFFQYIDIDLPAQIGINSKFFVGVEWPQSNKDYFRIAFDHEYIGGAVIGKNPNGNFVTLDKTQIGSLCIEAIADYSSLTNIKDIATIDNFNLFQNYPNPFNPSTTFKYSLPQESRVQLNIYNILGQLVAKLFNDVKPAGYYSFDWEAKNIASGVYLYRFEAFPTNGGKPFTQIKKMILLK